MSQVKPLSFADHGALCWQPSAVPVYQRGQGHISVALDEIAALALQVPLMVQASGDLAEPAIPVRALEQALPAFFGQGGRWSTSVIPWALRHGPFQITPSPLGDLVLVDAGQLVPVADQGGGSQPLFLNDETLAPVTEHHLFRLRAWRESRIMARKAATALQQAGCLVPWQDSAEWRFVDAAALAALSGAVVCKLYGVGAVGLAHILLVSQGHLDLHRASPPSPAETPPQDAFLQALRGGFL
jgi:hypothetical protein